MKKNIPALLFTVLCITACLVPSVGMAFDKGSKVIGNENITELPKIKTDDGKYNSSFLPELGTWFEKNYALRPSLITADAKMMSGIFKESNTETVISGRDGWMYYTATLDDYLGRNLLSERSINNVVRNLEITQDYVKSMGADFIFTVAPNKNTLYPEGMPYYYSKKASTGSNIKNFKDAISSSDLNYVDLFDIFKEESEVLYLKQDSHWNNKGALLAYNKIMDSAKSLHKDFADAAVTRSKNFRGDLANMLYPNGSEAEYNYDYDINQTYSYITPTKSVEEAMIKTENPEGDGNLFMYRDSFGNALLPYFANEYGAATFLKTFPVNVSLNMEKEHFDTVIFEIAQRNLGWFAENPPVIPAKEVTDYEITDSLSCGLTIDMAQSNANMTYLEIKGNVCEDYIDENTGIFIMICDKIGEQHLYEAFRVTNDEGDCGFIAYLPFDQDGDYPEAKVVIENDGKYTEIK